VLERKLSNFLLPGPFAYAAAADCFVTYCSRMEIECFKYASLVPQSQAGQRMHADWSIIIGEEVVNVVVGHASRDLTHSQVDVVVVSTHMLLALQDNGSIRSQKRIEYVPLCATLYPNPSREVGGTEENLIVGTHAGTALIYCDMRLLWSARLMWPPAAMGVHCFGNQNGLLVSLAFDGTVTISYLGTDPPTLAVVPETKVGYQTALRIPLVGQLDGLHYMCCAQRDPCAQELNYEAMDEEHRSLLQTIRNSSSDSKIEPSDGLTLTAQVPLTCEPADSDDASVISAVVVRVFITYSGSVTLENVTLVGSCTLPVFLTADTVVLPSLASGNRTPTIVPFTFRARVHELPISLGASVIATYTTPTGEPRCAGCEVVLPFAMIAEVIPPVKTSEFKITLDTNRSPPLLTSLFEDLFAMRPRMLETMNSGGTVLSVRYQCGLDATVLFSKNSGRFRVQSSSFEGLWLFTDELVRRLAGLYSLRGHQGPSEEPFAVDYAEPLPLQEYFELIDEHLRCRAQLRVLSDQLTNRAQQFRIIEKRLLVRLKDRNPAPMQNLELLFDGTYHQLLHLAEATEIVQQQLRFHGARLAAGTRLLLLLLRLRFGLNAEDAELIEAHLSPVVNDTPDQGWEERTDAAITHLLRSSLSKETSKDVRSSNAVQLVCPTDASKLKKHITLVADRLHKGLRPIR